MLYRIEKNGMAILGRYKNLYQINRDHIKLTHDEPGKVLRVVYVL